MPDTVSRPSVPARGRRVAIAAVAVLGLAAGAAPAQGATPSPATITSAFSPAEIGVGTTTPTALTYTLTNPNSSSALSAVSFTDTLPAGLTVDDPNGLNGNCGSGGTITAAPGSGTVSLSGGSIKAGSTCAFSVSVVASQTGTLQDTPGAVTSSGGTGSPGPAASVTVLPPPTLTVTAPRERVRLNFGQVARARYACTQPGDATALASCSAVDDNGRSVDSGAPLNTRSPGAHTLTIDSTSSDGLVTEKTIDYVVLPDNRFTVSHVKADRSGVLHVRLTLPGAGTVRVVVTSGRKTFARVARRVASKRTLVLTVPPSGAGSALAKALTPGQALHLRLQIAYTPTGGVKRSHTARTAITG